MNHQSKIKAMPFPKIKETIIVEGKDDERAVKQAVDAEVIITSGFAVSKETFRRIKFAREKTGVIIFTDPDRVGEQIRERINHRIKGCKNAYLVQEEAIKKEDIGIENARPQSIRNALEKARCITEKAAPVFTIDDLTAHALTAESGASKRREKLGKMLGIGYANSKQLLRRLNHYGISRDQFEEAVEKL